MCKRTPDLLPVNLSNCTRGLPVNTIQEEPPIYPEKASCLQGVAVYSGLPPDVATVAALLSYRCSELIHVVGFTTQAPDIRKILDLVGRGFEPRVLPSRAPPLFPKFSPNPFPDYDPQ